MTATKFASETKKKQQTQPNVAPEPAQTDHKETNVKKTSTPAWTPALTIKSQ